MSGNTPLQTGFTRVFITEGGARADRKPTYSSCTKAMGLDKGYGDETKIECPDPNRANEFIEMGTITGAEDRATSSLVGRYFSDQSSVLMALAEQKCEHDVHVHIGKCTDPSVFDTFTKALVLEGVKFTNYSTDDLGALESGERAVVNETLDMSVRKFYEVLSLSFTEVAGALVTNEIVDGVICDEVSCGDCELPSSGCQKIYFITTAAGGSPTTPADLVFSLNKGGTWYAHDVDTLGTAEAPDAIACVGEYVVVVSNDSNSLHYAEKDDITATNDESWTEVTTGFVTNGEPNDIWSVGSYAFIVGDAGYIYGTDDPTGGVDVLDAGVATALNLLAVHALDSNFAVAVGQSGVIVKTSNQTTWGVVTPTNVLFTFKDFNCVWVKSETEWYIGGNSHAGAGELWVTYDGGATFTQITSMPGTYTTFTDIQFVTNNVVYLAGTVAGPRGRVLRSYNGGYSWKILPESAGTMPLSDRLNAIATCSYDVNLVVAGGLGDNGSDGILVVGQD